MIKRRRNEEEEERRREKGKEKRGKGKKGGEKSRMEKKEEEKKKKKEGLGKRKGRDLVSKRGEGGGRRGNKEEISRREGRDREGTWEGCENQSAKCSGPRAGKTKEEGSWRLVEQETGDNLENFLAGDAPPQQFPAFIGEGGQGDSTEKSLYLGGRGL
ncbi:hypothetical protein NDU88_005669 [Pleurodeles waltl]|uniref:Uncharacterized protein n=1 Tax=Pleurodeles waltl TaxID=8319 RepID=A0AAV7NS61_PLEWA|nr:hypothetical protein NDU88_005669 [Pleurodeles waltl]